MKKLVYLIIPMLVFCLCLGACAPSDSVRITVNEVTHSVFYAPFYAAVNLGYFRNEGLVLAKESNKLLVISGKALDCQKYNSTSGLTTWEECSLRYWLNDSFLNEAFSEEEQALIQSTAVSADKNPQYSTNPGNATTDKIFLLSCIEAEKYFATDNARQCSPTKYAYSKKVNDYTTLAVNYRTSYWWLRSPSMQQNVVAMINPVGSIEYRGITTSNYCYVRPALWISIE